MKGKIRSLLHLPWDKLVELRSKISGRYIVLRDLDGDDVPELLYLVRGRYWRLFRDKTEYFYTLCYRAVMRDDFGREIVIEEFAGRPEGLIIDDVDGDRKADIMYFQVGDYLFMRAGSHIYVYKLVFMKGRGDGTFEAGKVVETFAGLPEPF